MMGRAPTRDDLISPTRRNTPRNNSENWATMQKDLKMLGLRERRVHDLRRTFVTLARSDGARKDVLEWISHGPRGDIVDMYTSLPWALLCAELGKLATLLGDLGRSQNETVGDSGVGSSDTPTLGLSLSGEGDPFVTAVRWRRLRSVSRRRATIPENGQVTRRRMAHRGNVFVTRRRIAHPGTVTRRRMAHPGNVGASRLLRAVGRRPAPATTTARLRGSILA